MSEFWMRRKRDVILPTSASHGPRLQVQVKHWVFKDTWMTGWEFAAKFYSLLILYGRSPSPNSSRDTYGRQFLSLTMQEEQRLNATAEELRDRRLLLEHEERGRIQIQCLETRELNRESMVHDSFDGILKKSILILQRDWTSNPKKYESNRMIIFQTSYFLLQSSCSRLSPSLSIPILVSAPAVPVPMHWWLGSTRSFSTGRSPTSCNGCDVRCQRLVGINKKSHYWFL